MKAVLLAGGEGKRLKAVSGECPKPLVPLLGRPLLEHILLLLQKNGIREVCCALGYRAGDIISTIGDGHALGMDVRYHVETEKRGTAGAVKDCADFYGEEDFLVLPGDVVCDFDLAPLVQRHRRTGAAATLALRRCADPLRYGLAVTDAQERIRAFLEKPDWPHVVTNRISTGIYVLSPRALEPVPEHGAFDFARDLFPLLLRRGQMLLGCTLEGYWCDVGTPRSYYRCCLDVLEGRTRLEIPPVFLPSEGVESSPADEDALSCPCRSRAATMDTLSALLLPLGAEVTDGLCLRLPRGTLRLAPRPEKESIGISVASSDAEFAQTLAFRARELIKAIDK